MEFYHQPIMLNEVLEGLNINPSGIYLDCTLGGGGHSQEVAKKLTDGKLIGIDKDEDAIKYASERLKNFKCFTCVRSDFKDVEGVLEDLNIEKLDGVLIDLGISSHQIDDAERGFSFLKDARLDMRMDNRQDFSAYDIVNYYEEEKLAKIIYEYGEEEFSRKIARAIVEERKKAPIETTKQLNDLIENCLPKAYVYKSGGCAKKTFQALRIEVNGELDRLKETLEFLIDKLKSGGRMAVLSFHSLEDRIVKNVFKEASTGCTCPSFFPVCTCGKKEKAKIINKKPIIAGDQEIKLNSRSKSAKLRILEKI